MIREQRYIVIKHNDISNAISSGRITTYDYLTLCNIVDTITESRCATKPERSYVVVQDNWPEYEEVWKMIEKRIDENS